MGCGGSTLKILDPRGKIVEYLKEMTVQEIEDEFPGYCVSEGVKQFKNPKSDIPSDTVLRMGKTYYLKSKSGRMQTHESVSNPSFFTLSQMISESTLS